MEKRTFGRLGREATVIGLGCWQLGADWGNVGDAEAMAILHAAVDGGVTFFDTADVYGDGRSERFVGRLLKERPGEKLFVATKTGRRAPEQIDQHYTESNLRSWVQRSLDNLGVESLDLVQWHCPPTETIQRDSMYELFDTLTSEGLIAGYGVSVETVVQALIAIDRPQVKSIQIIANAFRIKPFELVMPVAARAGVGIIVRVPLASGLLAAKYKADTVFGADDHRNYNRDGAAFDFGETFSGVPFQLGIVATRELGRVAPADLTPAQAALRWIIDQPGVTTVIPGASGPEQVRMNVIATEAAPISAEYRAAVARIYDQQIRQHVHELW
jgi:aryl-alcohol dehydrogenase-like predicted oxidoreductase